MEDNSFLYFTSPEVLSKIDIDPRLEDSFKRVMNKLQEYFNANGYTSQRNYKEYLEKYLLDSGKDNLRIYINEIANKNVGGFYNRGKSEICINENILLGVKERIDSTLCHEFIHFLVTHELVEGKSEPDIFRGGFIDESLTEMLTQQMYPTSNAYDAQVAMQKFANLVSGKENNFSRFLQGFVDARYSSQDWENYRKTANLFQSDFIKAGYINLLEAQNNPNFIKTQRYLISLFLRPYNSKTIEEYIEAINKLIDRPVKDNVYVNENVIAKMDSKMISDMRLNNPEIIAFMQKKLIELRQQILELKNAKGYEIEIAGRKIYIDENHNLYGNLIGINRQWSPKTGVMTFTCNGERIEIDTNKINFHQKEEQISQQISQLSSYFAKKSSKDLNMISSAKSLGEGLNKIEKFDLPTLGEKVSRTIYVATYNGKIVILNDVHQLSNISNIDLNKFIGMTSRDPSVAAIYSDKIGQIQNGITFSTLSDKQIQLKAISLYANEFMSTMSKQDIESAISDYRKSEEFYEDTEEAIKKEAISIIARKQFSSLSSEQMKMLLDKVIANNPQFVVSSKDGKIEVSTLFGDKYKMAFASKSEVLFNSSGKGLYNEVISSLSNTQTKSMGINLPIDSDGELIMEEVKEVEERKTTSELLNEYNQQLSKLQSQYGIITTQIENLMQQNASSLIPNYQEKLNGLIQQRDNISKEMEPVIHSQRTFQQAVDLEKEQAHKAVISQVERLLSTRIKATTDTGRFIKTDMGMFPQMDVKDSSMLSKEQGQILQRLRDLHFAGEIDLKSYQKMQLEVTKEYQKMIKSAPKPNLGRTDDDNQRENNPIANPTTNAEEQQYQHKYDYDGMMSEEEKEIFEERLRQQRESERKKHQQNEQEKPEKERLEEERRDLRRHQFGEKMRQMGIDKDQVLDMDELFRQQQIIEEMNREQEEIEQNHGMHM